MSIFVFILSLLTTSVSPMDVGGMPLAIVVAGPSQAAPPSTHAASNTSGRHERHPMDVGGMPLGS